MNLKALSNHDVLRMTKDEAKTEKESVLRLINLLREVESRRLFLDLGYGSMFEYVTGELGYDESAANRRITASRLVREIPEVEEKLKDGSLTLSNLVQAQVFFRKERRLKNKKPSTQEKKNVLSLLENKSARVAQKTLLALSPEQVHLKETEKPISDTHTEIRIVIPEGLREKLENLKHRFSHKNPRMSYVELIEELANRALRDLEPTATIKRNAGHKSVGEPKEKMTRALQATSAVNGRLINKEINNETKSRYISADTKRRVWSRDQGRCTFIDSTSEKRCQSQFQVQFHHNDPFAKGGDSEEENIRLLCRQHNVHQAIADFGEKKMSIYLPIQ